VPVPAGAGPPVALEHILCPSTQAALLYFFRSLLHALDRRLLPCWAAGFKLPWACARQSWLVRGVVGWPAGEVKVLWSPARLDDQLSSPYTETHARYCSSMREAAGSREGVAVAADSRQKFPLLLAPLSPTYGVGGW
jgi:hypothetical protein